MKKNFLLATLVALTAINQSVAQELVMAASSNAYATATPVAVVRTDPRQRFYFGVKGGLNYANVYDAQGENFQASGKLGFATGAFFSIPIGPLLGVQAEGLFSQRGFRGTGTLLGSSYEVTRTTNYLDLPVMLALKPFEFLTVMAGPQFSYLLKRKDVFTNSSSSISQEEEFNNDNIRKNTLCLLGGVDLNLHPVVLGLRAGWDLQKNNGDGTSTTPRYKNVWIQATVGFRF